MNPKGQARLLEEEPAGAPVGEEAPPRREGVPADDPRPVPPSRAPLDLEASRRALEARQVAWFRFRAEWIRRRASKKAEEEAAGTAPGASSGDLPNP